MEKHWKKDEITDKGKKGRQPATKYKKTDRKDEKISYYTG